MAKIFQNWSHNTLDSQHIPKSEPKIFGHKWKLEQGCHIAAFAIHIKKYLKVKKKNYENSKI
jgi:hypothetical protein